MFVLIIIVQLIPSFAIYVNLINANNNILKIVSASPGINFNLIFLKSNN